MRKKSGQAIVEFLLIFIPFFMIIIGIMQMAYIGVAKLLLNHAAFAVARVGVVTDDLSSMRIAATNALPFKNKEDISIEVLSTDDANDLEINVIYKVPLFFPIINQVLKETMNLSEYKLPIKAYYILPRENVVN